MKKLTSLFIAMIMILLLTASSMVFSVSAEGAWDGTTAATEFSSGDGTEASPYIIATPEQFKLFADLINDAATNETYNMCWYKLSADIDLGGNLWYRIGVNSTPFSGVFDGDGHTVSNFLIYEHPAALFGNATNSTIKNLKIDYADICGMDSCAAGIVANVKSSSSLTIENCEVGSRVRIMVDSLGNCARVGGIWGDVASNAIVYASNCINRGKIVISGNGGNDAGVGGIGGAFRYGYVKKCVNLGSVVSTCDGVKTESAGGILGIVISPIEANEATIENVINCANVIGYTSGGGIIGTIHSGTANLKITNAFSLTNHISIYADESMALGYGTVIGSLRNETQTCTLNNVYSIEIPDVAQIGGAFPVEGTFMSVISSIDALAATSEYNDILSLLGIDALTMPVPPSEETEPDIPTLTPPDENESESETDPEQGTVPADPVVSDTEPEPTEPEATNPVTPDTAPETEKPSEGGCGSVVASGLAIVAVVALAGIAIRKKN